MVSDACSEKSSTRKTSTVPPDPTPLDAFSHLVKGYPMLAGRMSVLPEIAMFRRYGALNARNLLYLQNELVCLEEQLIAWEKHDNMSAVGMKKDYAVNAYWLNSSSRKKDDGSLRDGDTQQRDVFLRIRQTLNEYSALPNFRHNIITDRCISRSRSHPAGDHSADEGTRQVRSERHPALPCRRTDAIMLLRSRLRYLREHSRT